MITGGSELPRSMMHGLNARVCAVAALTILTASGCGPRSSPHEWKTFVAVEGQPFEVPTEWISTPEGKFAHSIKLPEAIPKPVPFNFTLARVKALWPWYPSVSRQYWEHLCATEAGSFILKTVENVDGFVFLRATVGLSEVEQNERWKNEAPKLQSDYDHGYDPRRQANGYVNPPLATFRYVEYPDPERAGAYWKLSDFVDGKREFTVERIAKPVSHFAATWRGVRRPRDRENLLSGHEWIVLDRSTMEVLAVFRDFSITGFARDRPEGIYWLNGGRCAFRKQVTARQDLPREAPWWIPRVLKPAIYPQQLQFVDQRLGENK